MRNMRPTAPPKDRPMRAAGETEGRRQHGQNQKPPDMCETDLSPRPSHPSCGAPVYFSNHVINQLIPRVAATLATCAMLL